MSERGDRTGLRCPICKSWLRVVYESYNYVIYCPRKGCKYNA